MDWYLLAFASALFSAAAAISQKKILFEMNALKFSTILSFVNIPFALVFLYNSNFSELNSAALVILYGKSILGAFAFWSVMLALKNMEISGALPQMVLTPGFVALFAFLILGESLTPFSIVGMVLLLAGTYVLEMSGKGTLFEPFKVFVKSEHHRYIIYALALFTVSSLLDKYLLRDYKMEPYLFVGFQQIFIAVNFFIIFIFVEKSPKELFDGVNFSKFKWIVLISFFTVVYRYAHIEAVKIAPVALVLTIKRTSVFFATAIGGKLFSEHKLMQKIIATIIMLVGVYLIIG